MKQYIYPKNLKMSAKLLLWRLKDGVTALILALIGIIIFGLTRNIFFLGVVVVYGVLTIDLGSIRIYDYIKSSVRFFAGHRIYFWRL